MTRNETLLAKIEELLDNHPQGLKQAQMARLLETHPETIARALIELNRRGILLKEDDRGFVTRFAEHNCRTF
jgi:Mn-dependent DtxR family transcriptional regulator